VKARDLFDSPTRSLADALQETADLLAEYGPRYDHWAVAYSGGKDSTALLTAVLYLIDVGIVAPPKTLTVLRADTRMELPPLDAAAEDLMARLRLDGYDARTVLPPLDDRFFVYMLGRGVPPPSNTFRWCTDKLKISPMANIVRDLGAIAGTRDKTLMLTGVRIGESARRDESIAAACSRDGAECGQGRIHLSLAGSKENDINRYFVPGTDGSPCDTLAPVLHWRVCHVWDWLNGEGEAPDHAYLPFTERVADAYGFRGEKRYEEAARTGCVGCNLASRDVALDRLIERPKYTYLSPLKRLRELYAELKKPCNRLRKPGGERRKDGDLCANQNRMGPLTFDARRKALAEVLSIQADVNAGCLLPGAAYSLINQEEHARILELIALGQWPHGWDGTEPRADQPFTEWRQDGTIQPGLFDEVMT
jgi:DNA sulfur modification protein DndC